jgi:hypothetical protein
MLVGNVVETLMEKASEELAKLAWTHCISPGLEATWNWLNSWFTGEDNNQINNQIPTLSAITTDL